MNLINKLFFTLCLSLFTTFAYGDTANDILNRLTDKISSIVENTLGGDTEFSLEFPEDDDVELEILKFKELDSSDGQNSFSQLSIHTQEVNDDTRYILNFGYGQRYISSDKSMITGINGFIDYDTEGHARTSLGFEAKAPILELTGNYYLGLSGVETINGVNEKVLDEASSDVIFLHCLPAKRGQEISENLLNDPRSRVWNQAENRLHAQKGLLLELLK